MKFFIQEAHIIIDKIKFSVDKKVKLIKLLSMITFDYKNTKFLNLLMHSSLLEL